MRNIQSIKVLVTKREQTVYVNFDNGTFGMRIFNLAKKEWRTVRMSDEELTEARKLSVVNKKWTNWRRPAHQPTLAELAASWDGKRIADVEGPETMELPEVRTPSHLPADYIEG